MNGDKPSGIVPEEPRDGSGRPSNRSILSAFAVPVGAFALMSFLSSTFGFSRALWIMSGLAVCTFAVMTPILLRRNRKNIQAGNFREAIDGLSDDDGRFEVTHNGTQLEYRLGPPYNRVFSFVEPLAEIAAKVTGSGYVRSAAGSGVTPIGLFTIHVWESALTAKDGENLMELRAGGVRTFRHNDG